MQQSWKVVNSTCISKVVSTGYADVLDKRYERKKGISDGKGEDGRQIGQKRGGGVTFSTEVKSRG